MPPPIVTTGSGRVLVFCWCCPTEWEQHYGNSHAEVLAFRCRLDCRPTHHYIHEIELVPPAFRFCCTIEQDEES
jgi:hypothetical protein